MRGGKMMDGNRRRSGDINIVCLFYKKYADSWWRKMFYELTQEQEMESKKAVRRADVQGKRQKGAEKHTGSQTEIGIHSYLCRNQGRYNTCTQDSISRYIHEVSHR